MIDSELWVWVEKVLKFLRKSYVENWDILLVMPLASLSILLLDFLFFGYEKSTLRKLINRPSRSIRLDLISYVMVASQLSILMSFALSFGISAYFHGFLKQFVHFQPLNQLNHPFLEAFLFMLFIDFLDYWFHRLHHNFSTFWNVHHFHHSCEDFVIFSAKRTHPFGNMAIKTIFYSIPILLFGTPIEHFLIYGVFREVLSSIQHAQFPWTFGWIGRHILISPVAHRLHHALDEKMGRCNYGTIFCFWDKLFGTFRHTARVDEIGVPESRHNNRGYIRNILTDYVLFWVSLLKPIFRLLAATLTQNRGPKAG